MLLPLETVAIAVYLSLVLSGTGSSARPDWLYNIVSLLLSCGISFGLSWIVSRLVHKRYGATSAKKNLKLLGLQRILYMAFVISASLSFLDNSELAGYDWPVPLKALAGIGAFLLIAFSWWIPQYRLHRATMPGNWSFLSYLLFQIRYRLYILLLWFPLLLLEGVAMEYWTYGLLILPLAGIILFPAIIRRFWGCQPVGDDLREELQGLAKQAGARIGGFYFWEIGGGMVNAAAVGLVYPFSYVFLSQGLVRAFEKDELLAVIGHELGHLKNRHLLFHFLYIATFFSVLEMAALLLGVSVMGEVGLLILGLGVYVRFVFGAVSRAFERQADLFGAQLCGTDNMCHALEKIAQIHGGVRSRPCWHHYSIAERTSFLYLAQSNAQLVHKVIQQARFFMIGGVCCGVFLLLGGVLSFYSGV